MSVSTVEKDNDKEDKVILTYMSRLGFIMINKSFSSFVKLFKHNFTII